MTRALLVVITCCFGILISSYAFAQVPARTVRLDMDANILEFSFGGWNPAGPQDWRVKKLVAGLGNPNAALGLGVTVVDALTIGLRFSIAFRKETFTFDEEDSKEEETEETTNALEAMKVSYFRWGVSPYLEYAFLSKVIRPFIMVMLGFEGNKDKYSYETATYWDFIFGLGGGLHLFANPSASIDATILLGFSAGGGNKQPIVNGEEGEKARFTRILFRLTGNLGISGWF